MKAKYLIILLILTSFLITCKREADNPFDPNYDPALWAPTNLVLKQEENTIKLSWQQEEKRIDGFKIEKKTGDGTWITDFAKVGKEANSFSDEDITLGETYYYKIYAYAGENYSKTIEQLLEIVFNAPSDLEIEYLSNKKIKLFWQDNSFGEDGFIINKKAGDENWEYGIDTLQENAIEYIDSKILLGESYTYAVYAFDGNKTSDLVENTINLGFEAPTNLQIEQLSGISFKLAWQDNSYGEDGFKIDRLKEGGTWEEAAFTINENITEYTDNTIEWNTSYSYRVYACSGENLTDKIEQSIDIDFTPTNLQIQQLSGTSLQLTWQDNSLGEDGYKIDRLAKGGNWETAFATINANQSSYTDNSITWNTSYSYKVYAYSGENITNKAEQSINIDFTPTNLQIQQLSPTSLQLTWQDNSLGEDGFKIDRLKEGGTWEEAAFTINENITEYTDNTIEWNTSYTYKVYAFSGENITNKAEQNIEIDCTPTNLQITQISGTSLQLTWQDNSLGEDGFKIDRLEVSENWETDYAVLNENITEYIDYDLISGENYTYRVYAYSGISNSNYIEKSFYYFLCGSILTDNENNDYNTIKIGNQCWMKENLKTTHYADGTALVDGTGAGDISGDYSTKYYFWYDNDSTNNGEIYGALYTWAATMNGEASSNNNPSGVQGICPNGWHVPSRAEWTQLTDYLGGESIAGGKMKESGTIHWNSPNTGATNESGFSALPSGYRSSYNGSFNYIGSRGCWWSSRENGSHYVTPRYLFYDSSEIYSYSILISSSKECGYSVRCVRD